MRTQQMETFYFVKENIHIFLAKQQALTQKDPIKESGKFLFDIAFFTKFIWFGSFFHFFLRLSSFELAAEHVMVLRSGTSSLNLSVAFSL